jgi:AcrR family transcriptional regulator
VTAAPVRAGRPRSAEADDAIRDAAMDLFCEQGYDGLSVEGVACRAGVAKSTIYRRYPAKLDLVMAAIERAKEGLVPTPDSGSLREDLLTVARGYLAMLSSHSIGRAIPMMLVARTRSEELAEAHTEFVWTRRAATHELIQRGIDRGELPPGTDPAMIADMVFGAIFTRVFVTGQPTDDGYLVALVDRLLA